MTECEVGARAAPSDLRQMMEPVVFAALGVPLLWILAGDQLTGIFPAYAAYLRDPAAADYETWALATIGGLVLTGGVLGLMAILMMILNLGTELVVRAAHRITGTPRPASSPQSAPEQDAFEISGALLSGWAAAVVLALSAYSGAGLWTVATRSGAVLVFAATALIAIVSAFQRR